MSEESDVVDRLAQSIADGTSIDWAEIDRLPADARLKRLFKLLRIVDEVAEVHRSAADEPNATDAARNELPPAPAAEETGATAGAAPVQWGHLVLRRKIGEGAFGEVYHAHDTWLDHPVALKLFKSATTAQLSATRILHEARKLARIRHPNIVAVHGADSHGGRVGFWMDLIEGTTLEAIVRDGRLSAGEATYIGQEVCKALAAVHLAGIVHRDVKAQNVMRASDGGRIILMDFGAGEFIADRGQRARRQGTPLYLAPEIFDGAHATARSDIYAVGVLLYFLVTGDFPVRAASLVDLAEAHRRGSRRRLRDGRPDLPGAFVSIVERALEPDPARRFSSAGEMEAALARGEIRDVRPIDDERVARDMERSSLQTVAQVSLAAVGTLVGIEVLGLIACRVFDVALGVEPDFAAGFGDYFEVGVQSILPFGLYWLAMGIGLAGLAGAKPFWEKPLAPLRERVRGFIRARDGETIATIVFLAGVAGWLAICGRCWPLFVSLESLRQGAPGADLSPLASAAMRWDQAVYSALLSFFLGLAAWRWFPVLERQAADPPKVRLVRWATFVLVFVIVATASAPRRLIWERFEVAAFGQEQPLVIGRSSAELLLYYPSRESARQRRVARTTPGLELTGRREFIFDRR